MHEFLSMKTSIEYLHVRLKSRLAITKNKVKTSPALVTAQLSMSKLFLVSFEPHFGRQNPSKTEFWEPLNRDNINAIIIALQNKLCYPFVTLLSLNGSRHPPQWISLWHRFSLRLPFQKFASSPTKLQRQSQALGRFPSPEQQWNGKR